MIMSKESNTASNANLFGDDTDSSDESVGGKQPAKSTTSKKIGDDDSSSDEEEESKKEMNVSATTDGPASLDGATQKKAGDGEEEDTKETDSQEKKSGDSDKEVKQSPPIDNNPTESGKNNNSALFGDDDDSSEDDEFDGNDDGIVGKKGGVNKVIKPKDPGSGQTYNQKMGLESDNEDENEGTNSGGVEEGDEKEEKAYVPPRKMQLLDISDIVPENQTKEEEPVYHVIKLPNLVGINTTAYDRDTHDMEKEEEEYRGYVHNMIRWRYKTNDDTGEIVRDEHGHPVRESNTRVVKWSDGSYTLHVGKEVLEMDNLDSSVPLDNPDESLAGFPGNNGYLYVSQKAKIIPPTKKELEGPPKSDEEDMEDDEEEELEAKNAGTVLECIAPITSRLAPRPLSLTSDAHRNLTLAVRQRNVKRARIAEIVTEVDPEKEKQARIKGKDDLAKSRARSSGRRSTPGSSGRKRGMNSSYLEDEDDYDGVNISRLKKQTMNQGSDEDEMDYGSESSDEEDEGEWLTQKKQKRGAAAAKKTTNSDKMDDSSEEGEVVFGDSSDEDAGFGKKRGGGSAAKKAVFDSDDE